MPLSAQEERCVDLACQYLGRLLHSKWQMLEGETLDEKYPDEASPEILMTDGTATAAVEVKRLAGDSVLEEYRRCVYSLKGSLAPSCGGYYYLDPPIDLRFPLDRPLRRVLKREIERVASTIGVGEMAAVRVPREAHITFRGHAGQFITCCHVDTGHIVRGFSERLAGTYFMDDLGSWEHSFATEQALEDFFESIKAACRASVLNGSALVKWQEEWALYRVDDAHGNERGVRVVAATEARDVPSAVAEITERMIEQGLRKFANRRWANLHILVLDGLWSLVTHDLVKQVVSRVDREEIARIDMILLVEGDQITSVYHRPCVHS